MNNNCCHTGQQLYNWTQSYNNNISEVHQFPRNSVMEFHNIFNEMVASFFAPPCILNCFGPSTEPCGTPDTKVAAMDSRLQAWITCVRSFRKSASQSSAFPHTPKRRCITSFKIEGWTESNAAERSSSINAPTWPWVDGLYHVIHSYFIIVTLEGE